MSLPLIAAQLGAALLALQIMLMLDTGFYRVRTRQFIGLGVDPNMERKVRRHGNLAENAALFVVMIAIAELLDLSATLIGWLALGFFVARIAHALSFSSLAASHGPDSVDSSTKGTSLFVAFRLIGASGTAISGLFLAGYVGISLLLG